MADEEEIQEPDDDEDEAAGPPKEEEPKEEPEEPGPSFMALYTSLMMLLMTFFIILFSMATTSTAKLHQAQDSIIEELSSIGLTSSKQAIVFLYSYMKLKLASPEMEFEEKEEGEEQEEKKEEVADYTKAYWEEESFDKSNKIGNLILLGINIERKKEFVIIKIPNQEIFYQNSSKLTHKGRLIIKRIFRTISEDFDRLSIHVHSSPIQKFGEATDTLSSFTLSTQMATTVARYILKETSISPNIVEAFGNGEFRPANFNPKNEEEVKMNNRVELWIKGLWLDEFDAV